MRLSELIRQPRKTVVEPKGFGVILNAQQSFRSELFRLIEYYDFHYKDDPSKESVLLELKELLKKFL